MKSYKLKINNNDFSVNIAGMKDNIISLNVNGAPFQVELENGAQPQPTNGNGAAFSVQGATQAAVAAAPASKPSGSVTAIEAPLPGVILSVDIKEGDTVKVGDRLMVMEAMKMENAIAAEKGGTIRSVKVKAQDSVLQGDILVEIA